jgi:putative transposase
MEKDQQESEEQHQQKQKRRINAKQKRPNTTQQNKTKAQQAQKIRIYPNKKEKEWLNQWFGVYRFTYNQCVARQKHLEERSDLSSKRLKRKMNLKRLRTHFANSTSRFVQQRPWLTDIPYNSRGEAIRDFIAAKSTARKQYFEKRNAEEQRLREQGYRGKQLQSLLLDHNVKPPVLKFKTKKKKLVESFYVAARDWNERNTFEWIKSIRCKEGLPNYLYYDTRIIKDACNRIYLIVLAPQHHQHPENHTNNTETSDSQACPEIKVGSIDPGIRTFATLYDNRGQIFEYGTHDINKIIRIAHHADDLQSRIYQKKDDGQFQFNHQKRYNMRKAFRKMKYRIKGYDTRLPSQSGEASSIQLRFYSHATVRSLQDDQTRRTMYPKSDSQKNAHLVSLLVSSASPTQSPKICMCRQCLQ